MTFASFVYSAIAPFTTLTTYHLLLYSTLLGTTLYQTFVITKVAFRALRPLSMPHFAAFQARVFPAYFNSQSLLLLLTLVTVPPYGPLSFVRDWKTVVPLGIAAVCAGLNWAVYGPRTGRVMMERGEREVIDEARNEEDISETTRLINRAFSKTHAMSIHLNLIAVVATVWYGIRLAARVHLD